MAKPLTATPPVMGEAAKTILLEIKNGTPNTPERIAMIDRADQLFEKYRSQISGTPEK